MFAPFGSYKIKGGGNLEESVNYDGFGSISRRGSISSGYY